MTTEARLARASAGSRTWQAEVDRLIGERLADLRQERKMTLAAVATRIGISYQQVQKYERGTSTLSVARLFEFTQVYEIDPATILSDLPFNPDLMPARPESERSFSTSAEGQSLMAAIAPMPPKARRALLELIRAMPATRASATVS